MQGFFYDKYNTFTQTSSFTLNLIMKLILQKILLIVFILSSVNQLFAQHKFVQLSLPDNSDKVLDQIRQDRLINADSTYKILNSWERYSAIIQTGQEYIYYYTDSLFGKVPMRVYIPTAYKSMQKSPCILMLHGAVGRSHFTDIDSLNKFDSDILFSTLKNQNYIVVRPVADRDKKFNWVVNKFDGRKGNAPNPTFKSLTNILVSLKKILNVDDNRIFAFGHSDGSDGAIGLAVYSPDIFAGFVAYNSMLNNIFAKDFYIRNVINTHLYVVHSDLDDLRPIQQTRVIINELTKIDPTILYKEYLGYQHEDKHLDKDVPYSVVFMNSESRNPYSTKVFWETDKADLYNSCNWLKITGIDTTGKAPDWDSTFNFESYNKRDKVWMKELLYYYPLNKHAAVKATYNNNIFNIEVSRVAEIELRISPVMVNLENLVIIKVNGKQVFSRKVLPDKDFLISQFKNNFDRQALWVTSIKVKVE